jgi:hypothetical protein
MSLGISSMRREFDFQTLRELISYVEARNTSSLNMALRYSTFRQQKLGRRADGYERPACSVRFHDRSPSVAMAVLARPSHAR